VKGLRKKSPLADPSGDTELFEKLNKINVLRAVDKLNNIKTNLRPGTCGRKYSWRLKVTK